MAANLTIALAAWLPGVVAIQCMMSGWVGAVGVMVVIV